MDLSSNNTSLLVIPFAIYLRDGLAEHIPSVTTRLHSIVGAACSFKNTKVEFWSLRENFGYNSFITEPLTCDDHSPIHANCFQSIIAVSQSVFYRDAGYHMEKDLPAEEY